MDSQKQPPAYSQTKDELFSNLETSSAGLSEPEVDRRLKKYGHNVLNEKPPKSILNMLKEQIFDPMILILLGAATFSALLNEWVEAGVIFFIVVINSIIGIIQENIVLVEGQYNTFSNRTAFGKLYLSGINFRWL